jgi:hypothetical protein
MEVEGRPILDEKSTFLKAVRTAAMAEEEVMSFW